MILHVFNADNDMALANGEPGYTPPASIQKMMQQTALLPTRWAAQGDGVLTADGVWVVDKALFPRQELEDAVFDPWTNSIEPGAGHYISIAEALPLISEVRPWGWSPAVCHRLRCVGVADSLLPDAARLAEIRRLSSRERAVEMLPRLTALDERLVGESVFCTTFAVVQDAMAQWPRAILKAPWSSSGKGIRYSQGGREDTLSGWCQRIIRSQGGVVVEPLYDKLHDFAMEFWSDGQGKVEYRGLSVFVTHPNGAYAGNRLWTESHKMAWLCQYADEALVARLRQALEWLLGQLIGQTYRGPLGVDMMLLPDGCMHPCVEINLRMTMGYASLFIPKQLIS